MNNLKKAGTAIGGVAIMTLGLCIMPKAIVMTMCGGLVLCVGLSVLAAAEDM